MHLIEYSCLKLIKYFKILKSGLFVLITFLKRIVTVILELISEEVRFLCCDRQKTRREGKKNILTVYYLKNPYIYGYKYTFFVLPSFLLFVGHNCNQNKGSFLRISRYFNRLYNVLLVLNMSTLLKALSKYMCICMHVFIYTYMLTYIYNQ